MRFGVTRSSYCILYLSAQYLEDCALSFYQLSNLLPLPVLFRYSYSSYIELFRFDLVSFGGKCEFLARLVIGGDLNFFYTSFGYLPYDSQL